MKIRYTVNSFNILLQKCFEQINVPLFHMIIRYANRSAKKQKKLIPIYSFCEILDHEKKKKKKLRGQSEGRANKQLLLHPKRMIHARGFQKISPYKVNPDKFYKSGLSCLFSAFIKQLAYKRLLWLWVLFCF